MDSLRKKYRESPKVRRGVDSVLKSKNYTDDYKKKIKNHIDSPDPANIDIKENILAREGQSQNEIIISTWESGTSGWVETSIYVTEELEKALDTVIDELIPAPPKQRQPTVPQSSYDDALNANKDLSEQLKQAENERDAVAANVEQLRAEIAALLQQVDAEKIKTAAAENEAESSEIRYESLLSDFQKAIQKGIEESVERVSLEAQVRGLQAQKETLESLLDASKAQLEALKAQLETLNNIIDSLKGQIQTQQGIITSDLQQIDLLSQQLELQAQQIADAQARTAAGVVLEGVPNTFDEKTNTGWKLPQSQIIYPNRQLRIDVWNGGDVRVTQGTAINLYNFSDIPQTFSLSTDVPWLKTGGPITIPARNETTPGVGYVGLKWNPVGKTNNRRTELFGSVNINVSPSGETHTINASYWKEVKREDSFTGIGDGIVSYVGQER